MLKFFVLLALLVVSDLSQGRMPVVRLAPESQWPIHQTTFIPAEKGLRDLQAPLNMMAASPKIEFVDRGGNVLDHCSGSVVSDSGTLLTAGHCVEQCLSASQAIRNEEGLRVVDRSRMNAVPCLVRVNGTIMSAEILASHDCRGEDRYKTGNSRVACKGLDFAVLKVDAKNLGQLQPCFQISSRVPSARSKVAAIGYPPVTARVVYKSGASDSNGKAQFLTTGTVIPFQNHCYHDVDPSSGEKPGNRSFGHPERAAILKRQVDSGDALQTTTDVLPGVSGAGLSDLNTFELVGVARSKILNSANVECVGSGFYTSTASILTALTKDYPQLDLDQVFRCEKNAFGSRNETKAPARTPPPGASPPSTSEASR